MHLTAQILELSTNSHFNHSLKSSAINLTNPSAPPSVALWAFFQEIHEKLAEWITHLIAQIYPLGRTIHLRICKVSTVIGLSLRFCMMVDFGKIAKPLKPNDFLPLPPKPLEIPINFK